MKERKDYSNLCDFNDDNKQNPCWDCEYFCFPIGCMYYESKREEKENDIR